MVRPLYCRKCGARLSPDSSFCSACGAPQTGNDQVLTNPPQEPAMLGTGRQPAGHMLHQRYRLLHTVGRGGMGAVYVAQDTQLGDRLVAIKEMSMSRLTPQELPIAVEQFRREAHLLANLHHPNLPAIHEYFSEQDRWYLVMSFIEGQNLQAALNTAPGNRLPINEAVRIGIELCQVLEYLHSHEPQVIFRDLKPLNIMLTPKGHICLIDFGIARHFKQEQTRDTAYYYSAGYAPPEQYGQSQTGPRSDIYSLGATLHQVLSGHNPASKPFQFSNLQLVDPAIPAPLARLITQMLEMNESARPASVANVREQLEQILAPKQSEPAKEAITPKPEQIEPAKEAITPNLEQSEPTKEAITPKKGEQADVNVETVPELNLKKSNIFTSHPRIFLTLLVLGLSICGAVIGRWYGHYLGSLSWTPFGSSAGESRGGIIGFIVLFFVCVAFILLIRSLRRRKAKRK